MGKDVIKLRVKDGAGASIDYKQPLMTSLNRVLGNEILGKMI